MSTVKISLASCEILSEITFLNARGHNGAEMLGQNNSNIGVILVLPKPKKFKNCTFKVKLRQLYSGTKRVYF